jgi:C-22 sterol desaturase
MAVNASFVSPTADAKVAHQIAQLDVNGVLSTLLNNISATSLLLTLLMVAVAYDQCELHTFFALAQVQN